MEKLTRPEFVREYGPVEEIIGENADEGEARYIYISEYPDCPYIGVEYETGQVWVYGARRDCEVNLQELEWYLSQEG